jgi:hypothetical protein
MIWKELEGSKTKAGDGTIKFTESVCAVAGALEDDHGAIVVWLGLVHGGACTVDEDEGAGCEIEVADHVGVLFLKLSDRGEAAGEDAVVNGGKVVGAFLELVGMGGNEFFS